MIEKQLLPIVRLLQKRRKSLNDQGLMGGNTGLCIFFYLLARKTSNPEYEQVAEELLDTVFSHLDALSSVEFGNGLAGVGWGIEYLVQNGFAEGDTDEILTDIDARVFRVLNEKPSGSLELTDGLTGYLCYLISRLQKPQNPDSMAQCINRELLSLVVGKMNELITIQAQDMVKGRYFDLFWKFPVALIGLHKVYELNQCQEEIAGMIEQWQSWIDCYIPRGTIRRIYWAVALELLYEDHPAKQLKKSVDILLYAADFDRLEAEMEYSVCGVRHGWMGQLMVLKKAMQLFPEKIPSNNAGQETKLTVMTDENPGYDLLSPDMMGLENGWAGRGLMMLLFPEIFNFSKTDYEKTI